MPLPNPTFLSLGLVNGETGNIEWFKVMGGQGEYSFQNDKHVKKLIEWITKDFIIEETKKHMEADRYIKGAYWEDGKGCAIGCSLHSAKTKLSLDISE